MKQKIFFVLILFLSFILRVYNLDDNPPSLNWDEVSLGYNAYSILKTGKDEWGENFPISFRAYGDYKLPAYIYLDVPFIAILGLNEWGVRIPSALLGTGFVVVIFLLIKQINMNYSAAKLAGYPSESSSVNHSGSRMNIAFWGMFLTAISPWPIIFSRIALEAQLSLFLTTAAIYLFLLFQRNTTLHKQVDEVVPPIGGFSKREQEDTPAVRPWVDSLGAKFRSLLLLSSILFGLTIFTYNSSRIVTPLLILTLVILFKADLRKNLRTSILSLVIFSLFFLVALPKALLQDSSARYRWTAIVDEGAISYINEQRGKSILNPLITKIIYNKATYFVPKATINYFSHFNPQFLYIKGGSNYQFSVPGYGLFYIATLPLFIFGLIKIILQKSKLQMLILLWLLIAPIPAAITRDSPHALRSILMIPPVLIITALGLDNLLGRIKIKYVSFALVTLLVFSCLLFLQKYFTAYKVEYSWSWQYGYKEVFDYIKDRDSYYSKIFITKKYGEPHEFLLFYKSVDPGQYRENKNLIRYQRSDWFWVDRFDKYFFINDWEIKEKATCQSDENCLLITSPQNFPTMSKKIEQIKFLDQSVAFDIVKL